MYRVGNCFHPPPNNPVQYTSPPYLRLPPFREFAFFGAARSEPKPAGRVEPTKPTPTGRPFRAGGNGPAPEPLALQGHSSLSICPIGYCDATLGESQPLYSRKISGSRPWPSNDSGGDENLPVRSPTTHLRPLFFCHCWFHVADLELLGRGSTHSHSFYWRQGSDPAQAMMPRCRTQNQIVTVVGITPGTAVLELSAGNTQETATDTVTVAVTARPD